MTSPTSTLRNLFYLLLICLSFTLNAQHEECGHISSPEEEQFLQQNLEEIQRWEQNFLANLRNPQRRTQPSCPDQIPITPFIFQKDDGTGGLTAAQLEEAMIILNDYFRVIDMEFYICDGIQFIPDSTFYDFHTDNTSLLRNTHNNPNTLNIYFHNRIRTPTSSLCGRAGSYILMNNSCTMNGSTFTHEVGHTFGLPHTHSGSTGANPELVDGSNCLSAGDRFCDTPADPKLSYSTVTSSCAYTGTSVDANGDMHQPDPRNIMSYSRKHCRTVLSDEQYARMRYYHENVRTSYNCGTVNHAEIIADNFDYCTIPVTVNFSTNITNADTYSWDFNGDGIEDSNEASPSYTYTTAGNFEVSLNVYGNMTNVRCLQANQTILAENIPEVNQITLTQPNLICSNKALKLYPNETIPDGWSTEWQTWSGTEWVRLNPSLSTLTINNDTLIFHPPVSSSAQDIRLQLINPCDDQVTSGTISRSEVIPSQDDFQLDGPISICKGESFEFKADEEYVTTWNWYIDTIGQWELINGQHNATFNLITPNQNYKVRSEHFTICDHVFYGETFINEVFDQANANFLYGTQGRTVEFTNTSANAQSYFWDFGNNNTSTETNPTITYSEDGSYTVKLIAQNTGCTDTIEQEINISLTSNNNLLTNSIQIQPNPVSQSLLINGLPHRNLNWTIYNLLGQSLINGKSLPNNGTEIIEVNSLPNGVFLLSLQMEGEEKIIRFVKQE